jgi:hypothetical protein
MVLDIWAREALGLFEREPVAFGVVEHRPRSERPPPNRVVARGSSLARPE